MTQRFYSRWCAVGSHPQVPATSGAVVNFLWNALNAQLIFRLILTLRSYTRPLYYQKIHMTSCSLAAWLLLQVELLSYPPVTPPRSVNVFVLSYVLTLVPILSYVSAYQWVLFDKFHLPQRIRRRRYRLLRWLRVLKPGRYKSFTQYSYTDCKIGQANPGGAFHKGFIRSSETNSERECI